MRRVTPTVPEPLPATLWLRFLAVGRRLAKDAPGRWIRAIEFLEAVAPPDGVAMDELHELAAEAMHLAFGAPTVLEGIDSHPNDQDHRD